jgi:hypothetical protein
MADLYRSQGHEAEVRRWCTGRLRAWSVPHAITMIPTTLGQTHLTCLGRDADVCVYLPGTNFNAATSTRILETLATRCCVVCPDLPGQPGLSAADRSRRDSASYSRWVDQVLVEARKVTPLVVWFWQGTASELRWPCRPPRTRSSR